MHNNKNFPRCPANDCYMHPHLVWSGDADPKALKCPVCKRLYSYAGKVYDEAEQKRLRDLEEKRRLYGPGFSWGTDEEDPFDFYS